MDEMRRIQKGYCHDSAPHSKRTYGCPCCRMLSNLNHFKKLTRRLSRHILRERDRLEFRGHLG